MHFTREPYNPIYFNNGSDANLVWDYTDPHNNVQSTLYSVQVAGAFVKMMVNDSRGVQEHPDIPPSYKGRVKIEGSATLVIKNINPEDNTRFKCEVRGSFIIYSVLVNGAFVRMMVNSSHGVQEHPNIPPSYKGRVKIEGRDSLVIKNINPEDNTRFKCEVRGSFFYSVESTVQLIVAGMYYRLTIINQT